MLEYECAVCGMKVTGLTCGKCSEALRHGTINNTQGQEIAVCECPNNCGRIKSPTCCGHDMTERHA